MKVKERLKKIYRMEGISPELKLWIAFILFILATVISILTFIIDKINI
jgi:hypothetical protein